MFRAFSAQMPLHGQGNGYVWLRLKLCGSIINDSYETRCRKGRRKSRSTGWAAGGRGVPANCPRCFPHRGGYLPIASRGRGVGVSPTPTRRLFKPSASSTPTVPGPSPPPHEPCDSGPAMTPLPQWSAVTKVDWLGGGWPWVSGKLSPVFSPPGWLLTSSQRRLGRLSKSRAP